MLKSHLQSSRWATCTLLASVAIILQACAGTPRIEQSPQPTAPVQTRPSPVPAEPPGTTSGTTKQVPDNQQTATQELEQILQMELSQWRKDYAKRQRLGASCPAGIYYAYGMRLLQPSTFRGDYAELIKQRFGKGSEFLVIAVAERAAAKRAGILPGDRLIKVGPISANESDSARRVANESRKWRQAYAITLERDGKTFTKTLTPDKLCDVKL
jgi:hypothetical protein